MIGATTPVERMVHSSDCALHDAPALPAGPCTCAGVSMRERLRAIALGVLTERDFLISMSEVDALLDSLLTEMETPSDGVIAEGASSLIYPSLYMGGPPESVKRSAERALKTMLAAIREGK